MSQPNNPPSNPLLGAIYIDQSTNLAWVWTGTYWIQAGGSGGYNAQVGPGTTLVPGYYADPSPEDWLPFVGNTPPVSPQPGQIWVDTSVVPYTSYVWDSNQAQFIVLGGGSGADTNSIVSSVTPTVRTNGDPLVVGDLWVNPSISKISYWSGSSWVSVSSLDTNSILSSSAPTTRNDGSPLMAGDLWTDLDNNVIQYYNGTSFVPITAASENVQYGAVAPTLRVNGDPLVAGDIWTDSLNGVSYYWNGSTFVGHKDVSSIESTTAPTTNVAGGALVGGDQWYDPTTKYLYTYDSTVPGWVQIGQDSHGLAGAGDPVVLNPVLTRPDGNPLVAGDQYFDTSSGGFYAYSGTGWASLVSADTHSFVGAGDPNTVAPYSAGNRPDSSVLLTGDQYIDSTTDLSYYWTGAAWEKFGSDTHSFLGNVAPTLTARPDGNPLQNGDLFIDQVANKFYYYTGGVWKLIGGDTHSIRSAAAPTTRVDLTPLQDGDMWVDTDNGNVLSVYNIGLAQWESTGSDTHSFSGPLAPALTLRPDGQALLVGDQYLNTTTNYLFAWNGSAWVNTGANTHSIRAISAPGTRPDGSALEDGDMWVDTDSGNILYVYNLGTTTWDLVGPDTHSFAGVGAPTLTLRPDGSALLTGDQYLATNTKLLYSYDGAAWVIISGDTHAFTGNGAPTITTRPDGSALVEGDEYIDKVTGLTYAYYNAVWNLIGSDTHSFLGTGDPVLTIRPDGSPLKDGDLWIDKANKQLWYYESGTASWNLQTTDLHSFYGVGDPAISNPQTTRPNGTDLVIGDQYVDSNNDVLYYWNGSLWEILSGDGHCYTFANTPTNVNFPTRPDGTPLIVGDQVLNTNTDILYYWDGGSWVQVNPDTHTFTGTGEPVTANPVTVRPNTSPLVKGDLYIDEATEYLYYYTGITWERITSKETHSFTGNGLPNVIIGTANRPDGDPLIDGDQYFDQASNLLYTYIAGTWTLTSPDTHSFSGAVPPSDVTSGVNAGLRPDGTALLVGDQYIDTATQLLYSWYGGQWNVVSGDTHSFTGNVDPASAGSGVDTGTRPDGTPLKAGDMYVNTVTKQIWYYDTALSQWVASAGDTHSFTGTGVPTLTTRPDGTALQLGDQYRDLSTTILYGRNASNTAWVAFSTDTHTFTGLVRPPTLTTRPDSSPLVEGDLYLDVVKNSLWYWSTVIWEQINTDTHSFIGSGVPLLTTRPGLGAPLEIGDQYVDQTNKNLYFWNGSSWAIVSNYTQSFMGSVDPASVGSLVDAGLRPDGTPLQDGDLYVNTTTQQLWYYDTTLTQWSLLAASPDTHSFTGNGTPFIASPSVGTNSQPLRPDGSALVEGDQYWDKDTNIIYGYNGAEWVTASDDTHSLLAGDLPLSLPLGVPNPVLPSTREDGTPVRLGDIATANDGRTYIYTPNDQSGGYIWKRPICKYHAFLTGDAADPRTDDLYRYRQDGTGAFVEWGDSYLDFITLNYWIKDGSVWARINRDTHAWTGVGAPSLVQRPSDPGYTIPLEIGDLYVDTSTSKLYYWDGLVWDDVISDDKHSFTGNVDPTVAGSLVDAGNRPDGTPLLAGDQYLNVSTGVLWGWTGALWTRISKDTHSFVGSGTPYTSGGANPGTNPQDTRPNGDPLVNGDLYIDTNSRVVYYYDGSEWYVVSNDTHSFSNTVNPSDIGSGVESGLRPDGSALLIGDQFVNESTSVLWFWNGVSWLRVDPTNHVILNAGSPNGGTGRDNGEAVVRGDLYVDTSLNQIYYYDGVNWEIVGADTHSFTGPVDPALVGSGVNTGTRPDGINLLVVGDQYINTGLNSLWYWNGSNWIRVNVDTHSTTGSGNPNSTAPFSTGFRADGTTAALTGDIYFDTSTLPTVTQYVYDSGTTTWYPNSDAHTYVASGHPTLSAYATGTLGKTYVDTSNNEFFYWNGSAWTLLGPAESSSGNNLPLTRANGIDQPLIGDTFLVTPINRLYVRQLTGWEPAATHNFVQDTTPPAGNTELGDTWVDTTDMTMYVYYNDGSTNQWAPIA